MDRTFTATIDADVDDVRAILRDLGTYQHWMGLADVVEEAAPTDHDEGPAHFVTLVARLGPFARRKRLRMVRSEVTPQGARFDRREVDGREHSRWCLDARAVPAAGGTEVTMRLEYRGRFWSDALDAVLSSQVDGAVDGLAGFVAAR